jgi:hypothetical protein
MSWFLVVKEGVAAPGAASPTTFKLIVWGTGAEVQGSVTLSLCTNVHPLQTIFTNIFGTSISETTMRPNPKVPSLLFDLVNDPMEDDDLIASVAGRAKYAAVVSAMEQNLRSVVDYPAVALSVATYGKQMMAE